MVNPSPGSAGRRTVGWRVSGRVQGVGFRWFVREEAQRLGVVGDVRNLPDGRVEIRARGTAERLAQLEQVVRRGAAGADVQGVEPFDENEDREFDGFEIRR